ncbi:acyl-CoA reductase-like NAD-dependent aldehyde dehydrogenase [Nocardia transvalensis]|uniref:aldehyde dehydrogenase (NAD(+)) n=1 Tax=Nocardia transvalensis TaxID=37333 RepID=A0A7W9UM34_9NOCA|nr:aldehyde dehydrogenase [Nocardia transvalensis]MBB5917355.1 acyl-CoA reductase-like NAD-dependent aldehyde dehydrogenase [Nocardia transvalensis]
MAVSAPSRRHLYIGGEWVAPSTADTLTVVSPHTERPVAHVPAPSPVDVDRAVVAARTAFDHGPWPRLDPSDRIAAVRRLAEHYRPRQEELAGLITTEMGAPITFSRSAHARLPGAMIGAFADLAARHPWRETRPGAFGGEVAVHREPVGVVAAIIPWNMPMFLTVAKLVPALLAGCAVVLKPSPETPLDAYLMAELLDRLDLPPGVVSILPGDRETGRALVAHPGVDKVSFTGSTAAGRQVAAACGAGLRRVGLELGGKSAAVVLDDADPDTVADGLLVAGLMNSGQACVAQTRILVPRSRYREFVDALASAVAGLPVGDPFDPATRIGPMVSERQRRRVLGYIEEGRREGARMLLGGTGFPDGVEHGWYVRPTLFVDVDNRMRIAQEEIFGPVLGVIAYDDEDDAVRIANASGYGLSGSVWTTDIERGLGVVRRIRSGTLGINQAYSMDPAAPFGGVKDSGIGREFGPEGLDGFLDTKSVSIAPAATGPAE